MLKKCDLIEEGKKIGINEVIVLINALKLFYNSLK